METDSRIGHRKSKKDSSPKLKKAGDGRYRRQISITMDPELAGYVRSYCDRIKCTFSNAIESIVRAAAVEERFDEIIDDGFDSSTGAVELLPDEIAGWLVPLSEYTDEEQSALRDLKDNDRRVLLAILNNCCTGASLTPWEISKVAGVKNTLVRQLMNTPSFIRTLNLLLDNRMKFHKWEIVNHLFTDSSHGKTASSRLFLELAGEYQSISRMLSMNVNVDATKDMRGVSEEVVKEEVVKEWKKMGWSKAEFLELWGVE